MAWYWWLMLAVPLLLCTGVAFFMAYKLYHPYRKSSRPADVSGLDARSFRVAAGAGIELDGLLLHAQGAEHLVLIAHELGAFKETKIKIARRLVAQGFSVMLFDLRNHGASSKDRALWPMSERFTSDVEAMLRFVRAQLPQMRRLSLYTFSFSTFPSLYIVNRDVAQPDLIVLDSGPHHRIEGLYGKFLDEIARNFVPRFLRLPLLYSALKHIFQFFGLRMLGTTWPPDLSRMRSQVLFMMNGRDPVFPEQEIRHLAQGVPHRHFWSSPNSTHLQGFAADPEGYERALVAFLRQDPAQMQAAGIH